MFYKHLLYCSALESERAEWSKSVEEKSVMIEQLERELEATVDALHSNNKNSTSHNLEQNNSNNHFNPAPVRPTAVPLTENRVPFQTTAPTSEPLTHTQHPVYNHYHKENMPNTINPSINPSPPPPQPNSKEYEHLYSQISQLNRTIADQSQTIHDLSNHLNILKSTPRQSTTSNTPSHPIDNEVETAVNQIRHNYESDILNLKRINDSQNENITSLQAQLSNMRIERDYLLKELDIISTTSASLLISPVKRPGGHNSDDSHIYTQHTLAAQHTLNDALNPNFSVSHRPIIDTTHPTTYEASANTAPELPTETPRCVV